MLKNRFFLLFILFLTFNIFVSCSLIKKRSPSPIKQETTTKDSGTDIDDKVIFLQQKEIDLKNLEDFLVEKQKSLTTKEEDLKKEKDNLSKEKQEYENTIKTIKELKSLLFKLQTDLKAFDKKINTQN